LNGKKTELDKTKEVLQKYDWLDATNSANEVLNSFKNQLSQIKKDITEISDLGKELETHETALAKYKPKIEKLESQKKTFTNYERRLDEARRSTESLKTKVETAVEKTGLLERDLDLLLQDIHDKKQKQLMGFGLTLVASIAFIIVGLLINTLLSIIGIALIPAPLYMFRGYQRIDRLQTLGSEVISLKELQNEQNKKMEDIEQNIKQLAQQTGFKSAEEVDYAYSSTINELTSETGQNSMQGLEAINKNSKDRLKRLKDSNPDKKAKDLEDKIQTKEEEIENFQKNKPSSVDKLLYDKLQHESTRYNVNFLQDEYNTIDKDIQNKLGTVKQLNLDLETLKYRPKKTERGLRG